MYYIMQPNATRQAQRAAGAQRTLYAVACTRLILIEAPSSAYHGGRLRVGNITRSRGGVLRRFYTQQHQLYCGIDLHARTLSLCILNHDGASLVHRHMPAGPEPFLQAVAPDREALVVCGACLCTCYGLADLCARDGMPCVLGPALSLKAMHGGTAKNDTLEAQHIALRLRGGMRPQA
jgi:hypothetical protein